MPSPPGERLTFAFPVKAGDRDLQESQMRRLATAPNLPRQRYMNSASQGARIVDDTMPTVLCDRGQLVYQGQAVLGWALVHK
jgi:hypothetical protein